MGNPADDIYEPHTDPEDATKFVARVILTQIWQIPRDFVVDDWIKMDWRNGVITHQLRTPNYNPIVIFCIFIGTASEFQTAKRIRCPKMWTSHAPDHESPFLPTKILRPHNRDQWPN